jgi:hypothetical protein
MAFDQIAHQARVNEFKNDLSTLEFIRVVRKHITTGSSAVLAPSVYYELRDEVADHFKIHPSAVVLIGSGRTGFSLKPSKRFEAFGDASDLDLAIVSREKFDEYWDLVFAHWQSNRLWSRTRRYRHFLRELFKGWIWPRRLPPGPRFKKALEWVEFEDRLGRERFRGLRSVGARLYRTWDRLEAYQAIHVRQCLHAIEQEKR